MSDPGDQKQPSEMTERELVAQIERAFALVPYPGDDGAYVEQVQTRYRLLALEHPQSPRNPDWTQ